MKPQYKLVGQPTLYQLQMINARTHVNYKQEDLYVFEFTLCNNLLDPCFNKLSVDDLPQIRDKCIGATIYIDVPNDHNTYTARIFNVLIHKKDRYAIAYAYIFRTNASQKVIDFIEELMSKQTNDVSMSIYGIGNKCICNANNVDSKCHIIDELTNIVDKDWNNFKVTKDSKYLYSTLKFIEMLQETV